MKKEIFYRRRVYACYTHLSRDLIASYIQQINFWFLSACLLHAGEINNSMWRISSDIILVSWDYWREIMGISCDFETGSMESEIKPTCNKEFVKLNGLNDATDANVATATKTTKQSEVITIADDDKTTETPANIPSPTAISQEVCSIPFAWIIFHFPNHTDTNPFDLAWDHRYYWRCRRCWTRRRWNFELRQWLWIWGHIIGWRVFVATEDRSTWSKESRTRENCNHFSFHWLRYVFWFFIQRCLHNAIVCQINDVRMLFEWLLLILYATDHLFSKLK